MNAPQEVREEAPLKLVLDFIAQRREARSVITITQYVEEYDDAA